ncbi:TonB-dependent receptor [Undibacterium flavidum]|uniref:TonB-dependent receptor n=1 Tax=Undibacterium flavidum TaxID=2762297 RepID=A0ABR6YHM6_9BURK|nr:TonB-dependent receptor [Undibacterium flavidum]MBC3875944.1 TonB-dependent receptor [Undibacterium flavidum]
MSKRNMIFKKNLVAHALMLAFGAGVMTVGVTPAVMAQSSAAGNIFGQAPAGSTVSIVSPDTGLKRTAVVDASGRFNVTAMPIGRYNVEISSGGKALGTTLVEVVAGQGVDASVSSTASAGSTAGVQSVQVTARRTKIDISNTNNGATFTARELAAIPVAKSVSAIIQLAPNTTRGDTRYAAGDSFGGGAPSENAFYINGFPVTNPLTQLGASELPFGSIAQAQVLTGGFGSEFGRSVGGVVNITTKSGTNNWEVGATSTIRTNAMSARAKDGYYAVTGDPLNKLTDGKLRLSRQDNESNSTLLGAYVGGPLIKDTLFMFLSVEQTKTNTEGANAAFNGSTKTSSTGWLENKNTQNRFLGKFDWNINDDHRLELTMIGDDSKSKQKTYDYTFLDASGTPVYKRGSKLFLDAEYRNDSGNSPTVGADVSILRYVGNLTNNLTMTISTGQSKSNHAQLFVAGGSSLPATAIGANAQVTGVTYPANQNPLNFSISPKGAADEVKSSRFDLEYKLGDHTIRGGLDVNKLSSVNAGQITPAGASYTYLYIKPPANGGSVDLGDGHQYVLAGKGGYAPQGYYVQKTVFSTSTSAASDQSAQYIEDKYQVTKNLLVTGGLRFETFSNRNGDNETFIEQKNKLAPRLSAAWDVNGDASFKVFGSAGRYHVQIPTNVTIRGASRATNTVQYFSYTGVDANAQPLGLVALGDPTSANNELGQRKDARTISATNMEPTFQDEITLGFEKAYSPEFNFGVKGTIRQLKATADDWCDQRPVDAWALRNKVDTSHWDYGLGCVIINPGKDVDLLVDFTNGDGKVGKTLTPVHLTAAEVGLPRATRLYKAIDVFAEHPLRNGWYGKVNYTWSRSTGTTEGQTNSDTGQANVSITAVWDFAELMQYADGLLPNNRTHQLKAYGFYQLAPEWTMGANFLAASGRPKSCLGRGPTAEAIAMGYGSAFHYCKDASGKAQPAPRGSFGTLPTDMRLDMNIVYKPAILDGIALKLDVFNITNRQVAQQVEERRETAAGIRSDYDRVISYTTARRAALTVEYNKKF